MSQTSLVASLSLSLVLSFYLYHLHHEELGTAQCVNAKPALFYFYVCIRGCFCVQSVMQRFAQMYGILKVLKIINSTLHTSSLLPHIQEELLHLTRCVFFPNSMSVNALLNDIGRDSQCVFIVLFNN